MELFNIIYELKITEDDILYEQSLKLDRYMYELSHNIIPWQLCRSYIQDVRDKIQLDIIFGKIIDKETAQWVVDALTQLLIGGIE